MMPITHFLGLLAMVIAAAGMTVTLAFCLQLPLAALAFATVAASLALGARQWR